MKVLLTDGSGLSSRQVANILDSANHAVHLVNPPSIISVTTLTRHVTKHHIVPPFGKDPFAWRDVVVSIVQTERLSTIICTQEQVAILSAYPISGTKVALPSFTSMSNVFDKTSAYETLKQAALPQPETFLLKTSELQNYAHLLPAFIKLPIGTASNGVSLARTPQDLNQIASRFSADSATVLLQKPINGTLLMITSVFSHGQLLGHHCCLRVREGLNGGAVSKISYHHPQIRTHLSKLGHMLSWHGALSMDAMLDNRGNLYYIDVNPRLVEPTNAYHAGLDLVALLLDVTLNNNPRPLPEGKEGVKTHQAVLGLLDAASKCGRRGVIKEVWNMAMWRECYKDSVEELTPVAGDWLSGLLLIAFVVVLLLGGSWVVEKLTSGAVRSYALGREGWEKIVHWNRKKLDSKY